MRLVLAADGDTAARRRNAGLRRRKHGPGGYGASQGGDVDSINEGEKRGAPLTSTDPREAGGGGVRNRSLTARRTPLVEVQIFQLFF
jgi:hypothetical protein